MMFRSAMNKIGAHSENTAMIGDRMDTDIVAGIEAGLHTVLVLTGISDQAEIERYPFRPDEVLNGVFELVDAAPAETEFAEGSGKAPVSPARAGHRDAAGEQLTGLATDEAEVVVLACRPLVFVDRVAALDLGIVIGARGREVDHAGRRAQQRDLRLELVCARKVGSILMSKVPRKTICAGCGVAQSTTVNFSAQGFVYGSRHSPPRSSVHDGCRGDRSDRRGAEVGVGEAEGLDSTTGAWWAKIAGRRVPTKKSATRASTATRPPTTDSRIFCEREIRRAACGSSGHPGSLAPL